MTIEDGYRISLIIGRQKNAYRVQGYKDDDLRIRLGTKADAMLCRGIVGPMFMFNGKPTLSSPKTLHRAKWDGLEVFVDEDAKPGLVSVYVKPTRLRF